MAALGMEVVRFFRIRQDSNPLKQDSTHHGTTDARVMLLRGQLPTAHVRPWQLLHIPRGHGGDGLPGTRGQPQSGGKRASAYPNNTEVALLK